MDALLPLRNEERSRQEPARMAALAKLPVFWSLEGKRVVVSGGSDAAAWKAELLAACGAEVHIYAPTEELGEVCAALIRQGAAHPSGCFVHHNEVWQGDALAGAALAVADCESEEEAEAFFEAAQRAGVPVNVIDKPAFCQFQFGSIVNRSPVVVSISTDGAAPILAQAIRRRIETLLPPVLKDWAVLAQTLRDKVNVRLKPGAPRRAFWERFVDLAFQATPEEGVDTRLVAEMERLSANHAATGRVTLVGAGPGDSEYLTLKAVRALQAADVILFDDLVSNEVLELARRERHGRASRPVAHPSRPCPGGAFRHRPFPPRRPARRHGLAGFGRPKDHDGLLHGRTHRTRHRRAPPGGGAIRRDPGRHLGQCQPRQRAALAGDLARPCRRHRGDRL